jgi:uncharacterized protein (DUF885 family)
MIIAALLLALSPAESLHALIDRDWAFSLRESPEMATYAGVHDYDDRLERVDEETQQRRLRESTQRAAELRAIPLAGLAHADQVNAQVLAEELRARISHLQLRQYLFTIQGDESFYSNLSLLPRIQPLHDVADYERYLRRLRDIPRFFDENLALMRAGLASGMTPPQVILKGRDRSASQHAVSDVRKSVFYKPFEQLPSTMAPAEGVRLRAAGEAAIREAVVPAYAKVASFLANEYIP